MSIRTENTVAFKVAETKEELSALGDKITLLCFTVDHLASFCCEDGSGEESAMHVLSLELGDVGARIRQLEHDLPTTAPFAEAGS